MEIATKTTLVKKTAADYYFAEGYSSSSNCC